MQKQAPGVASWSVTQGYQKNLTRTAKHSAHGETMLQTEPRFVRTTMLVAIVVRSNRDVNRAGDDEHGSEVRLTRF
jgi:hypothetical protein